MTQNVQEFINICRERGLNVTYQRILIYKALSSSRTHPTAEEIFHQVKSEYPAISLATVYKTLETFADHELIGKVTPLHDLARYDADTADHHHLVCLNCRKILDVHHQGLNNLNIPDHQGFNIKGYRIQFEGVCQDCRDIDAGKEARGGDPATFCGK